MKKILTEDLMNQIRLMNYDRSKTVYEQITTPDKREFRPLGKMDLTPNKTPNHFEKEGRRIFIELEREVTARTQDEDNVVRWVKKINNNNYIYVLLECLKKNYLTVMSFVMQGFFKPAEYSEDHKYDDDAFGWFQQGAIEKRDNYYNNDIYVFRISDHLYKFAEFNQGEGSYDVRENEVQNLAMDAPGARMGTNQELADIAHIALPVIAFVLTLGSGTLLMAGVGALIELGDAAIYKFVDKDNYAAGLAVIFAFAGPLDHVLSPLIKKYGSKIIQKLMKKKPLNFEEQAVLKYVKNNKNILLQKTYMQIGLRVLRGVMTKITTLKKFVHFLYWLVKKGYLAAKFLTHFGIVVGGSFITWDKIASLYGICNSVQLKDLEKANYKILKLIGSAGPYLQPFTKGCDTTEGEKVFSKMDKTLENRRISMNFEKMIETNTVLSTKYSKVKMIETLVLQEALNYFDYGMINKKSDRYEREVVGKKKTKAECDTMDGLEKLHYPECMDYLKPVKTQNKERREFLDMVMNDTKGEKAINKNYKSPEYGISKSELNRINWGFYDEQTKAMVELFQKDNNLQVDGNANAEVFKILKTKVDETTKKGLEIPNYSKFEWSEEEIEKLRKEALNELKKEKAKQGSPMVTKQEAEEAFEQQKTEVMRTTENEFNKVNPNLSEGKIKELDEAIKDLENQ